MTQTQSVPAVVFVDGLVPEVVQATLDNYAAQGYTYLNSGTRLIKQMYTVFWIMFQPPEPEQPTLTASLPYPQPQV
jgi:hypothetical protein